MWCNQQGTVDSWPLLQLLAVLCSLCLAEYVERYGSSAVWTGYRRNHKGGIPPQKTRKTCIVPFLLHRTDFFMLCYLSNQNSVFVFQRGDKICGNPCPICRDPNIIVHRQVGEGLTAHLIKMSCFPSVRPSPPHPCPQWGQKGFSRVAPTGKYGASV